MMKPMSPKVAATKAVLKLLALILLLVIAQHALADCDEDMFAGWSIGGTCVSFTDTDTGLTGSQCQPSSYDPFASSAPECRSYYDGYSNVPLCQNSTCFQGCLPQGYRCQNSFQCCGSNMCENGVCAGGNEW